MSYCLCDNDDPVSIPLCQIHGHQPSFNHTCLEGIDLISEAHLDLYRCFCFSVHYTQVEKGETTSKFTLLQMSYRCILHTRIHVGMLLLSCYSYFFLLR